MIICLEQRANDLHMVQLMLLPLHHLLLQYNSEWFTFLVIAYPSGPRKKPLNGCSSSSTSVGSVPHEVCQLCDVCGSKSGVRLGGPELRAQHGTSGGRFPTLCLCVQ